MNQNQRLGATVIVVSLALMAIALVLSKNWGVAGYPLVLYYIDDLDYDSAFKEFEHTAIYTKYVIAMLVVPLTYGVLRYLSLVSSPFSKRPRPDQLLPSETSDDSNRKHPNTDGERP